MLKQGSRRQRFIDQFTNIAFKIGNQVHLRSLRDAFAIIMPLFILAGIGVLVNNVVFPWVPPRPNANQLSILRHLHYQWDFERCWAITRTYNRLLFSA